MKIRQNGRSMVEMLGVLAIVGVLSAGALAGYSKAMEKSRLNQWKDDVTLMIWKLYELTKSETQFTPLSIEHFVPEHLIKTKASSRLFYDIYNNQWGINEYGLFVRLGGAQGKQAESSIKYICPSFLRLMQEMEIISLSLNYAKNDEDEHLLVGYKELMKNAVKQNLSQIQEQCDTLSTYNNLIAYIHFK
ncbi:MAG TPA: hypothetical protein DIC64_02515 [Alphaproteobacteria bacterium]|nr:hypothetical protein [Alphaproteobacteria bacterium]